MGRAGRNLKRQSGLDFGEPLESFGEISPYHGRKRAFSRRRPMPGWLAAVTNYWAREKRSP